LENIKATYTVALALLTAKDVSRERLRKRLEICSSCEKVYLSGKVMKCGVCNCTLSQSGLINLARYEETDSYGCKHPDGSRWKNAGA